jgi:hypothetical protein
MAEVESGRLDSAAERLYAVPLAEFMALRAQLVAEARTAKDRAAAQAIGKLRKPSVAAGIVNALVRARPDLVADVESVGTKLRAAQANLHGTAIAALRPARDQVIADVLAGARDITAAGGATLTAAAESEIRDTVIAALASDQASHAAMSGALTRTLQYSGFGEVDLADAVVATTTGRLLRLITSPPAEAAAVGEAESDVPDPRVPEPDAPEPDAPRPDAPRPDAPRPDAPRPEAPEPVAPKPAPSEPGVPEPAAARHTSPEPVEVALEPLDDVDDGDEASEAGDHESLIEAAATAYQQAAAAVTNAKAAVREVSSRLDQAKESIAKLTAQLVQEQAEIEELFAADAAARAAVTAAVRERQSAAETLARREAAADSQ